NVDFRPAEARTSASKDKETHGQKLYFLFARNRDAYLDLKSKPQPEGQVIVKESWSPKEATEDERAAYLRGPNVAATGIPFARKHGNLNPPPRRADLSVMSKTADTADPDQGWVYGTVTADGKTVTSAGRVDSCMNCHRDAKHDHLFGLPGDLARKPFEAKK